MINVLMAAAAGEAHTWAAGAVECAAGLWAHCLSAATMQPEDVTIWLALADDSLDTVQRYSGPHAFIAAVAAGEPGAVAFAEQIDARAAGLGAFVADAMDAVRAAGIRRGIPGVTRVH